MYYCFCFITIPSFIEQPRDVDSVVGGGALFSCRATGYPRPNIIWKKNGRLVNEIFELHMPK